MKNIHKYKDEYRTLCGLPAPFVSQATDTSKVNCDKCLMILVNNLRASHDALLEACEKGEKRIKFLMDKILANESYPEKIILERIEIDKSFSCMTFIKQAIAQAKENE